MARGTAVDILDGLSSAVAIKGPCKVAAVANVTLSGEQTIDGVLTSESRVLVTAQTDARENGVYVTSSGDWRRAADFSRNNDVKKGTQVRVTDGGSYAQTVWVVTAADPVIDTDNITIARDTGLSSGALQIANNLSDLASAIGGWDALFRQVATTVTPAAGTLDLSGLTAPFANALAGTCSAITLAAGKSRLLRVSTAITFTASATLEVQGNTAGSFVFQPGALLLVTADAGGTVKRVHIVDENRDTKGTAIASAATVTLGRQHFYHITGAVTITDIDWSEAIDGAWAWLVFDSTPTIQHNATTLILPGAANITAAAGDRMLVVQDNADNAIVLVYQRADESLLVAATAAELRAGSGSKAVTPAVALSAMDFIPLTDAATIAVDHAAGVNRSVTLGGNRAFGAPSNGKAGWPLNLWITQDGTGTRVPTWDSVYDFGDFGTPVLSTGAAQGDLVTFLCLSSSKFAFLGLRKRVD